jgi:hypothetical protein
MSEPLREEADAAWGPDDWNTPEWILEPVRALAGGQVAFDPCSNRHSTVDAREACTIEDDSLTIDWDVDGLIFVNPPYSRGNLEKFAAKILAEAEKGATIVALVPANVETGPWVDHFWKADAICFPSKRVRFLCCGKLVGSPKGASAIVYFGALPERFEELFSPLGKVIFPGARPVDDAGSDE